MALYAPSVGSMMALDLSALSHGAELALDSIRLMFRYWMSGGAASTWTEVGITSPALGPPSETQVRYFLPALHNATSSGPLVTYEVRAGILNGEGTVIDAISE